MALPLIAGLIAGAGALGGAIYSARSMKREAQKNRDFQERMSSTAHQRAVADLQAAGINPMMAAGAAASSPGGSVADVPDFSDIAPKAVGTALAVKQAQANVGLTNAQTAKTMSEKDFLDKSFQLRLREQGARTDIGELNAQRARELLPLAFKQASADLDLTTSSARGVKARAALDELDRARAMNAEDLEEWLKGGTPGVRLFFEVLRGLRR